MVCVCLSSRLQTTLDEFAARLELIYSASGGKKINIISHSMGGLLVKCFMSLHSDVSAFVIFLFRVGIFTVIMHSFNCVAIELQIFEKYVKNWIAIAAPFQGMFQKYLQLQ